MKIFWSGIVLALVLAFNGCGPVMKFIPHDTFPRNYPAIGSVVKNKLKFKVFYKGGADLVGVQYYGEVVWSRVECVTDSVKVFGDNDSVAVYYTKEDLDQRRRGVSTKKEFWVIAPDDILLVPEAYHKNDNWLTYVKRLKPSLY